MAECRWETREEAATFPLVGEALLMEPANDAAKGLLVRLEGTVRAAL